MVVTAPALIAAGSCHVPKKTFVSLSRQVMVPITRKPSLGFSYRYGPWQTNGDPVFRGMFRITASAYPDQ